MCGQGGCAGTITVPAEKAFTNLLIYNGVRGIDSTGAASVKRHEISGRPQIIVAKEVGTAWDLMSVTRKSPQKDFSHIIMGHQRALLGHCRSSTRGGTTRLNAHPFEFENVVGTHNGTLSFGTEDLLGKEYSRMQTDSEKVFASINDHGIAETVKHLAAGPTDAYALVWYDTRDNTINFLRNKERPLFWAMDRDSKMLFWSSEFYHLCAAMAVQGIDVKNSNYVHELPVDMHYSFVIPAENMAFGKAHVVKREGRKPAPLTGQGTMYYVGGKRTTKPGTGDGQSSTGASSGEYTNLEDYADRNYGYTNVPGNAGLPMWDKHGYCWKKWSQVNNNYKFAWDKAGPWYDTPQKAWDSLLFADQVSRYTYNQYPGGIIVSEAVMEATPSRVTALHSQAPPGPGHNKEPVGNVTILDKFKNKKLDDYKAIKGGEFRAVEVFRDSNKRVFWDTKAKVYTILTWHGPKEHQQWQETTSKTCPSYVPFTDLDVSARHQFVTLGKKKNKVRAFRGFQGATLLQSEFEKIMGDGCINCQRVPQWGNDVHFITKEHFFCEHCARQTDMVEDFKKMNKGWVA